MEKDRQNLIISRDSDFTLYFPDAVRSSKVPIHGCCRQRQKTRWVTLSIPVQYHSGEGAAKPEHHQRFGRLTETPHSVHLASKHSGFKLHKKLWRWRRSKLGAVMADEACRDESSATTTHYYWQTGRHGNHGLGNYCWPLTPQCLGYYLQHKDIVRDSH